MAEHWFPFELAAVLEKTIPMGVTSKILTKFCHTGSLMRAQEIMLTSLSRSELRIVIVCTPNVTL